MLQIRGVLMALCDRLEANVSTTATACSTRCSPRRWRRPRTEGRELEAAE